MPRGGGFRNVSCPGCGVGKYALAVIDRHCEGHEDPVKGPSEYSAVRCKNCGHVWRTKARYAEFLELEELPRGLK